MSSLVLREQDSMTYNCVCYCGEVQYECVVQFVEGVQGSACGKSYNSCSSAGIVCFPHSMTVQCTVNVLCLATDIYM